MLYDKGKRIRIFRSHLVQCDGERFGLLKFREDDEEGGWWDLVNPNVKRFPITDDVLSNITRKNSVQEIGEYLDSRFSGE